MTDALHESLHRPTTTVRGFRCYQGLIPPHLSRSIRNTLMRPAQHYQSEIIVGSERHRAPRLSSSFSDQTLVLDGMEPSSPWTPPLVELRSLIEATARHRFNYALANLYRDGQDHTGWHCDKAELHTPGTTIAIASFGSTRTLEIRSLTGIATTSFTLEDSSVAIMDLPLQATHEHRIPVVDGPIGARLSITLRNISLPHATPIRRHSDGFHQQKG